MIKTKIKELRSKNKEDLGRLLLNLREKLRQLKFDLASGKIKNVSEIRKIRKEIAQILTVLEEHTDQKV